MRRVFIPNIPQRFSRDTGRWEQLDMRADAAYGTVVPLTAGHFSEGDEEQMTSALATGLHDFDPDNDYFSPIGHPIIGALAIALIAAEHGRFRILYYHSKEQRHLVVNVDVPLTQ